MLNEETMKSIKDIAEAVYSFGILSKKEARLLITRKIGMKHAELLDDGTIYVVDAQGQDAYLEFPLLAVNNENKKMAM